MNILIRNRMLLVALSGSAFFACSTEETASSGSKLSTSLTDNGNWDETLLLDQQFKDADYYDKCPDPEIKEVKIMKFGEMPEEDRIRYKSQIDLVGNSLTPDKHIARVTVDSLAGKINLASNHVDPQFTQTYWAFCTLSDATILETGEGNGIPFNPGDTTNLGLAKWNNNDASFYILYQSEKNSGNALPLGDLETNPVRLAVVNYCQPITSGKTFSRSNIVSGEHFASP